MIDQKCYEAARSMENTTTTSHDHELVPLTNTSTSATAKRSKKNIIKNDSNNNRRFSDEQIKSLEALFKMENKLEPRKKLEMARELGLHPRQVAIWFQNKRARWKSKQVEQHYTTLKADYDNLSHRFDSLKKEKHDLLQQLSNLYSQLKVEPYDSGSENEELNGNSSSRGGFSRPLEQDMAIYSYEDYHDPDRYNQLLHKQELEDNINIQQVISRGEAHEKVNNFDIGSLFDQSCDTTTCSNWWDVWASK